MAEQSNPIKCNVANSNIDDVEWSRIETQCKLQKHIDGNTNLRDLIKQDEEKLASLEITFQQLNDLFEVIQRDISDGREIGYPVPDCDKENINNITIGINNCGWCQWSSLKIPILNYTMCVVEYVWGGSERCPFQSECDKEYHGYEYGDKDYIFINNTGEYLHIGSLLFHQITAHHFFQDATSKFRVDIEKLVRFFNINPNTDYKILYPPMVINPKLVKIMQRFARQKRLESVLVGMEGMRFSS